MDFVIQVETRLESSFKGIKLQPSDRLNRPCLELTILSILLTDIVSSVDIMAYNSDRDVYLAHSNNTFDSLRWHFAFLTNEKLQVHAHTIDVHVILPCYFDIRIYSIRTEGGFEVFCILYSGNPYNNQLCMFYCARKFSLGWLNFGLPLFPPHPLIGIYPLMMFGNSISFNFTCF